MKVIYEARAAGAIQDFDSEQDAVEFVERNASGSITHFVRGYDGRDRSCKLVCFDNGAWKGIDITR